jgi:hypothetical protein
LLKRKKGGGKKMVSATIHLYKIDEFKVYIEKFADEYILTIETPQGAFNFIANNLKDIEELTRKMWAEVKYRALLPRREVDNEYEYKVVKTEA